LNSKRIVYIYGPGHEEHLESAIGVYEFARPHHPWLIEKMTWNLPEMQQAHRKRKLDGVIGYFDGDKTRNWLRRCRIPSVGLYESDPSPWHSRVYVNNRMHGSKAARFFTERKFRNFAFIGLRDHVISEGRQQGYCDELSRAGFETDCFLLSNDGPHRDYCGAVAWLKEREGPTALFVSSSYLTVPLREVCERRGVMIPESVSMLSGGTNTVDAYSAWPAVSLITSSARRVGYEGAAILHRMMNHPDLSPVRIEIEPGEIIERESTRFDPNIDPRISRARAILRARALVTFPIGELAAECHLSESHFYRLYKSSFGISPKRELLEARMAFAEKQLRNTRETIEAIAEHAGFQSAVRFSLQFKKMRGVSPQVWRERQIDNW